nr:hypothetical protein [Nanoarchaeota archaeon]
MTSQLLVAFAIAVLLIIVGVLIAILVSKRKMKGEPVETNYYAFFVIGISFLPLGIVFSIIISPGFMGITGLGVVYMIIGLANKDKGKHKIEKNK